MIIIDYIKLGSWVYCLSERVSYYALFVLWDVIKVILLTITKQHFKKSVALIKEEYFKNVNGSFRYACRIHTISIKIPHRKCMKLLFYVEHITNGTLLGDSKMGYLPNFLIFINIKVICTLLKCSPVSRVCTWIVESLQ